MFKLFKKNDKANGRLVFRSPFLSNLSPLQRYELLQYFHRRNYKEGEYIYYQNDPGTGMYFIEKGRVELIVEAERGSEAEENLTYELSEPDHFGELSIGYELRRMSSARCQTNCTLLGLFKPDFETLKKRQPVIAVKFLETLSVLAMKQFERATLKLREATDIKTAYSLQFSAYNQVNRESAE
jgi:CRP-like cAMP-binding protein